ncbi:hypothetical protein HDU97_005837 [Phlyctochytrium planicorne]|nr:hypothetical protein HDU97_005837 [Phlyctochytrium planicorne]
MLGWRHVPSWRHLQHHSKTISLPSVRYRSEQASAESPTATAVRTPKRPPLPTEKPLAFKPSPRHWSQPVQAPTVENFYDALKALDAKKAWTIYKSFHWISNELRESNPRHVRSMLEQQKRLKADDHTRMLGLLVSHRIPGLAARHAEMVWKNMEQGGHALDVRDLNNIMFCHLRNKDLRRVVETFTKLIRPEEGTNQVPVKPDAKSYHILMAAYGRSGDVKGMNQNWDRLRREMPASVLSADPYVIRMEGYTQINDFEGVWNVFNDYKSMMGTKRLRVEVLNAMVLALGVSGQRSAALNLAESFRSRWNTATLDAVIRCHEAARDFERAESAWINCQPFQVWHRNPPRPSRRYHPTRSTYFAMMRLYSLKGKLEELAGLHQAFEVHHGPAYDEREVIITALLDNGRVTAAKALFDEMTRKHGFVPTEEFSLKMMKAENQ